MQTKKQSLIEAALNTFTGFLIAWLANVMILPIYGFKCSASQSLQITVIFTVISIIRSYIWRRIFNKIHNT